MKIKLIIIIIIAFALFIVSCKEEQLTTVSEQKNHFNHQIFEENKLPPRATFFGFEAISISEKENSKRYFNLNGNWK